ncbi:MAG: glycosyl transferase family 51, partial [Azonexus sp.]
MSSIDPQQSYLLQPRPQRWKFHLLLGLIVVGTALAGVAWVELQESFIQASHFAERARTSTWTVEPGADKDIWLPTTGPYEQRLGYAQLNTFLPRLASAGFTVAAQARQSEGFRAIVGRGHFPIYREKSRAGLTILDRNDQSLYDSQYPRVQYADFEAIPPVLVEALLFIENRDLLDANAPKHNPAVDWG